MIAAQVDCIPAFLELAEVCGGKLLHFALGLLGVGTQVKLHCLCMTQFLVDGLLLPKVVTDRTVPVPWQQRLISARQLRRRQARDMDVGMI